MNKIWLKAVLLISSMVVLGLFCLYWFLANPVLTSLSSDQNRKEIIALANAQRLQTHVEFLSGIEPSRSEKQIDSLNAAKDYISLQFLDAGFAVELQQVPHVGDGEDHEYHNLIARYQSPPKKSSTTTTRFDKRPLLVVGAHYDSANPTTPGADDNASGVAGLLELARMIHVNRPKLNYPLELVAYTLEETTKKHGALVGSTFHARQLKEKGLDVKLMFSLEMIGYFTKESFSQRYPLSLLYLFYPWRGDFIALVSNLQGREVLAPVKRSFLKIENLRTRSINAPPQIPGVGSSDHASYWAQGWPAIMVTDTAYYRNFEYHLPGDTADRLDYEQMKLVVDAMYTTLVDL